MPTLSGVRKQSDNDLAYASKSILDLVVLELTSFSSILNILFDKLWKLSVALFDVKSLYSLLYLVKISNNPSMDKIVSKKAL